MMLCNSFKEGFHFFRWPGHVFIRLVTKWSTINSKSPPVPWRKQKLLAPGTNTFGPSALKGETLLKFFSPLSPLSPLPPEQYTRSMILTNNNTLIKFGSPRKFIYSNKILIIDPEATELEMGRL